jgi:RNA polymerase sigma-70 factor (ECF subfamily)
MKLSGVCGLLSLEAAMLVDFHGLFGRYSQDVYRFSLYLSADPSLAEEITQETFVRVWVMPGEIRGGTVKAYLLTIARNLYRAEMKRQARHVVLDRTMPDPKPGSESVACQRLELEAVFEALQSLPETDRAALLMHAQDGLSYAAIASALGLSITAVKLRVHRARMKLRRLVESKEA